jgi:hypothetical protein
MVDLEAIAGDKVKGECLGPQKLAASITKSLRSRPRANDLKYLLVGIRPTWGNK